MKYKNQHFVTEAYLNEWCDPKTPEGYDPYVWRVSKKTRLLKRKSPTKIFRETDFYTFRDSKGNRNLYIEHLLQKIESDFIPLLRDKISHRLPLDDADKVVIANFVATMFSRVKRQRDVQSEMWQELLDQMNRSTDEELVELKARGIYDQIVELRNQPVPYGIVNFASIAVPYFCMMNCEIYETQSNPGFITSDNPCFIYDSAILTPFRPNNWDALFSSPTVEILFPLSPKQLLSLKNTGPNMYRSIDEAPNAIDKLNGIIVANSDEFIVVNQEQFSPVWFEKSK